MASVTEVTTAVEGWAKRPAGGLAKDDWRIRGLGVTGSSPKGPLPRMDLLPGRTKPIASLAGWRRWIIANCPVSR